MTIGWRTIEELVPENGPAAGKRVSAACCAEKPSDRCSSPWASDKSGVDRCGDLMEREVLSADSGPILLGGVTRRVENRLCCCTTAGHGLRDPLPLHGVHQARGITNQKDPPPGGRGPDDPHLEPTAESARRQRW